MKKVSVILVILFALIFSKNTLIADDISGSEFKWNRPNIPMPDYWVTWDFKKLFGMCYMMKNEDLDNYDYCYEIDRDTYLLMKKAAKTVAKKLGDDQRHLFYDKLTLVRKSIYSNYLEKKSNKDISRIKEEKTKKDDLKGNLPDKIYVRFCSKGSGVGGSYDYKITLAPNVCNNLWGTFGSKWQITYDEWQESDKGYSSFPGKMDICYRPAANKITTNADKEHVNITYPGTSCIKSPRKFYKLKYLGDVSSSDKTAIFVLASSNISIAEKPKQKPEKTDQDLAKLEEEKRKIEEEKRKIEEEKRKIAEAKKKQEEEEKILIIGSGTGFFVNDQGHIITNNHVVEICKMMAAEIDGDPKIFKILATDEQNDLALIKGDYVNKNFLNLSTRGAVFGEDIVAFGYPLDTELSSSVKLTRGIVSSLSGPKNNISQIQIDAAIQPGNSGGPVLNYEGQVVGVASSGLNKWYMIEKSEYIPENVNFAVAAPTLLSFLKANNVNFGEKKIEVSKTKELAKIGMPSTIQLLCLNTKSTHEKHKKNKKYSDVLLKQVIELR